jgi:hypothetical protein
MNPSIIFQIIGAAISIGAVFIAIGVLKGKVQQNTEKNKSQDEKIITLVSKNELQTATARSDENLALAIKRSDEMLEIMRTRAEEDRAKGQGQWREFHTMISKHAERIGALETQQTSLMKSLDEIKADVKSGFKDIQIELKEIIRKLPNGDG